MTNYRNCLILFLLLAWTSFAHAVIETYEFGTEADEARYHDLTQVLRCPKCQNQNLDGSNAPIAQDLRRELARLIQEGKTDDEIVDFMVARYGDFVLYDPPFKASTLVLWVAPGVFLLIGLGVLWFVLRRRSVPSAVAVLSDDAPTVPLPAQSDGAPGWRLYAVTGVVILGASLVLYSQLGAWQEMQITRLTQAMYNELTLAARENREPDRAPAQKLISRLEPFVARHPDNLTMVYLLGSSYAHIDDYEKAIPHYKNYLMAVPTDEEALTEYVHILYFAAGRQLSERVQFVVERALTLNPDNVQILTLLARHHYEQGAVETALGYWEHILRLVPPDSETAMVLRQTMELLRKQQAGSKKKRLGH